LQKKLISKPTKVLFLQSLSKSPNTCCRLGLVLQELRSTAPESDAAEAGGGRCSGALSKIAKFFNELSVNVEVAERVCACQWSKSTKNGLISHSDHATGNWHQLLPNLRLIHI
jgi:hypothetical protein